MPTMFLCFRSHLDTRSPHHYESGTVVGKRRAMARSPCPGRGASTSKYSHNRAVFQLAPGWSRVLGRRSRSRSYRNQVRRTRRRYSSSLEYDNTWLFWVGVCSCRDALVLFVFARRLQPAATCVFLSRPSSMTVHRSPTMCAVSRRSQADALHHAIPQPQWRQGGRKRRGL